MTILNETLAFREIIEALEAPNTDELIVRAVVNFAIHYVHIWTGTGREVMIPFSYFEPSGDGTKPNFFNPKIIDGGLTLALGKYEAAADALLCTDDII